VGGVFSVLSARVLSGVVWAWNLEALVRGGGVGTLLSFEGSGDWLLVASWYRVLTGWWACGLGGLVVCELDSGREHLTRQHVSASCVGWVWVSCLSRCD